MEIITTADLLNKIMEFKASVPDGNWTAERLKHYPADKYRYRAITAILEGLNLDKQTTQANILHSFIAGKFIEERDLAVYEQALQYIQKHGEPNGNIRYTDIKWLFWKMLNYYQALYTLAHINSGVMEAGLAGMRAALVHTASSREPVLKMMEETAAVLHLIINPDNRQITKEHLVENHGYPEADIRSIDMENY